MIWTWSRFDGLVVDDLYDALALRCRVFILEQGPYQDPDGLDRQSWHLLGREAAGGELQAVLRIVDPARKYAEPSMGRVAVAPECRGRGLGHRLVAEGLARCVGLWPGQGMRISAQSHLEGFYRRHGFEPVGEAYLEDGIPHRQMVRSPA